VTRMRIMGRSKEKGEGVDSQEGSEDRQLQPPTVFYPLLILLVVAHLLLPVAIVIRPPYSYMGITPMAFGIAMNIWADQLFKRHGTPVKSHVRPTSLVTSGPFRISQHPMYLGMAAILFGMAVLLGSAMTFIFPLAFLAIIEIRFIPQEEGNMSERFGHRYEEYRNRVRRWI